MTKPLWEPPLVEVLKVTRPPFGEDALGRPVRDMDGENVVACVRAVYTVVAGQVRDAHPEAGEAEIDAAANLAVDTLVGLLDRSMVDKQLRVTRELLCRSDMNYSYEFHHLTNHYTRRIAGDAAIRHRGENSVAPLLLRLARPLSLRRVYALIPVGARIVSKLDVRVADITPYSAIVQWHPQTELAGLPPVYHEEALQIGEIVWEGLLEALPEKVHKLPRAETTRQMSALEGDPFYQWEVRWKPAASRGLYWLVGGAAASLALVAYWATGSPGGEFALGLAAPLFGIVYLGRRAQLLRLELQDARRVAEEQRTEHLDQYETLRRVSAQLERAGREMERRMGELTTLQEASLSLGAALEVNTVLENLMQVVVDQLDFDRAGILLYDDERQVLEFNRASDLPAEAEQQTRLKTLILSTEPPVDSKVVEAWMSGKPARLVRDAGDPFDWLLDVLDVPVVLGVPLRAGERLAGVLLVDNHLSRHPITANDERVLMTLATNAATVLENARLYQLVDEALALRVQELSMLQEIDSELNRSLDFERVMGVTLDWAMRRTGADVGAIGIVHRDRDSIRWVLSYGYEWQSGVWLPLGLDIVGRVVRENKALLIEDIDAALAYESVVEGMHTVVAVPVRLEGKPVGVISMESRVAGRFDDETLAFLQRMADRAAVAMENARLFEEVHQEQEKLAAVLAGTADAVIVVDETGEISLMNRAARAMLHVQRSTGALDGITLADLMPHSPLLDLLSQALETRALVRGEMEVGEQTLSVQVAPVEGVGWVMVMQDVTQYKEIDRLKSEFVAQVSHDLKSPLNIIGGYADLLEMRHFVDPAGLPYVTRINRAVESMRELIDELLDLARIESGARLDLALCPVGEVVNEAAEYFADAARQKGLVLSCTLDDDLPLALADRERLRQIVENLVGNAIKYTPAGGLVVIWASATENGFIRVTVQDNGLGIPEEALPKVFDRFFRVQDARARDIEGTGLGLAIVRGLVEAHGGEVGVHSVLNEGSTFYFTVPQAL
ncbi:MAG: GAF domain-containing protein [Anaerolineae bacterium]|nr:GAF domain-containing protein [Anaerolineae bacterium]